MCAAGIDLLEQFGTVEALYNLSPADLCAKVSEVDALIVRSATKVDSCRQLAIRLLLLYDRFVQYIIMILPVRL